MPLTMALPTLRELRSVLGPLRPVFRWQGEAVALTLTLTVLSLLQPLLIKGIVDAVSAGKPVGAVLRIGAVFAAYQLARGLLSMRARVRHVYLAQRVGLRVRQRLYHHVLRLSPVTPPGTDRGELLFRLTGDVRAVETLVARVSVQVVGVAVAILGALLGLLLLDWRLALIALLTVPVFVATTRGGQRQVQERAGQAQAAQGRLTALLDERLGALEAVHLARREAREGRALFRAGREGLAAQLSQASANARLWGGVEIVTGLTAAAVLTLGAIGVMRGALTLGSLLAFHLYVQHLFAAIDSAAGVAGSAAESLAGVRRVVDLLSHEPGVRSGPVRAVAGGPGAAVQFHAVTFAYPGGERALDGLSLSVAAGEHVAVVGATGCGKSTLTRALARFFDPQAGRVTLEGRDLRELDLRTLRTLVTVIPQNPAIIAAGFAENVAFSRPAPDEEVGAAAARACIDADLALQLSRRGVGTAGCELSGGQRQRLAVARAFLEDPRVLVLDEPTSAIDARTELDLVDSVLEFARGRTLIVITHNLRVAARFSRVVVMDAGRVVADASPAELAASGALPRGTRAARPRHRGRLAGAHSLLNPLSLEVVS